MVFSALSAQAVSLTFKFEVSSSGTSLYACNAGLKHLGYSTRVCYERANPTVSCNPALCEEGQACNCVCTGGFDATTNTSRGDGEYRLDFMSARVANWSDNGEAPTNIRNINKTAATAQYNTVVEEADKFSNQLLNLSFELGSERYGAEYYVDVCFRAPQITYPGSYNNSDKLNWGVDLSATITDIAGDNDTYEWDLGTTDTVYHQTPYYTLAGLTAEATLYCKTKSGEVISKVYGARTFDAGQLANFVKGYNMAKDLKGCYVRYTFKETNREGLTSVRKWKKQQARVCTYTSFNESAE